MKIVWKIALKSAETTESSLWACSVTSYTTGLFTSAWKVRVFFFTERKNTTKRYKMADSIGRGHGRVQYEASPVAMLASAATSVACFYGFSLILSLIKKSAFSQ